VEYSEWCGGENAAEIKTAIEQNDENFLKPLFEKRIQFGTAGKRESERCVEQGYRSEFEDAIRNHEFRAPWRLV